MGKIGILAYGSLIEDPGFEIKDNIVERKTDVLTPFKIEFARKSRTRGNAPTVIPVEKGGAKVSATVLVLKEEISLEDAKDLVWRRETRKEGSGEHYKHLSSPKPNKVILESISGSEIGLDDFDHILFTKIGANIDEPNGYKLASLAIESATPRNVGEGKDGISYLLSLKNQGIRTPLMKEYEKEILRQINVRALEEAIEKLRA